MGFDFFFCSIWIKNNPNLDQPTIVHIPNAIVHISFRSCFTHLKEKKISSHKREKRDKNYADFRTSFLILAAILKL